MKRLTAVLILALASIALGAHTAAPSLNLPIVGAQAQMNVSITTLIESDTTFVGVDCDRELARIFLSYIDRAHGNRLHLVEDVGDHVVEVPLPPLQIAQLTAPAPSFVAPGDKQADGVPCRMGSALHLYYTSRDEGDPDGPFRLKRLTMPLPPPEAP